MAENDIYNSKEKYDKFKSTYRAFVNPPSDTEKQNSGYKTRKYYCKNPENIVYFKTMFDKFEAKDISYVRRLRLINTMKLIMHATTKNLKDCDRPDVDKVVAFMHSVYNSPKSKSDFIIDIKYIWKVLLPEKDEKGRIDDTLVPYPVRHLSPKQDKSKEKLRDDKIGIEEFEKIIKAFNLDARMQAYLTIAFESLGRPQEVLYTKIKDVQIFDNYAKIFISEHGKEGVGFLQCIESFPYLAKWYNIHPLKHDPDAFLFINLGNTGKFG